MCYFKWVLLTSKSLFWRKQTPSIWFGDREMQTFREKTYTRNNSFMNYQQIYSFNQWNDWEEDTFLLTVPENNLKICYRLQNIAILVTERTQLPHPKKIFPRSSLFYRMWRHFSLDDPNTKNVPGVVQCSPPPLTRANHQYKLYVKQARLNCYKHSFFVRIVKLWNELPGDIVEADSFQLFKSKLKLYLNI